MSKEKVYPAIYANGLGCNILWFNEGKGVSLDDGGLVCKESTSKVKNITCEYLQNTYGEVQSLEHAEFILKLAKNAGFEFTTGTNEDYPCWFTLDDELYFFKSEVYASDNGGKQITIPLPPKAESKKWTPDFYELGELPKRFDCACNKCGGKCCTGQCGNALVVGDEVEFPSGKGTLVVSKPDDQGIVIVESLDNELGSVYKRVSLKALKKPKTPEEELRDDLISVMQRSPTYKSVVDDLIENFNITKKA